MQLTFSLAFSAPPWLVLGILAMLGVGVPLALRARRQAGAPGQPPSPLALPGIDVAPAAPAKPERQLLDRADGR